MSRRLPTVVPTVLSVVAALFVVGACGEGNPPLIAGEGVIDDRGGVHPVSPARTRIISLVPAMTETLAAIGGADFLVARTAFDEQEELAHLPSVGGGLDPSLEVLAELDPDLIVMWQDAGGIGSLSGRLGDLGIAAYQVDVQEFADFRRHALNVGALIGRTSAAEGLVAEVDQGLSEVQTAVSSGPLPTVLYLVQSDPPLGVGPGTFLDSLIAVAGGRNVLAEAASQWPLVSLEDVLWRDPTYIVVPVLDFGTPSRGSTVVPEQLRQLESDPGWSTVGAVREGRLVPVDAGLFGRPGPRMPLAARYLASRLHPGLFDAGAPPG